MHNRLENDDAVDDDMLDTMGLTKMHNLLEDDGHPISVQEDGMGGLGRKMQNHLEDDEQLIEDDALFVREDGTNKCSYSVLVFFVLYVIFNRKTRKMHMSLNNGLIFV